MWIIIIQRDLSLDIEEKSGTRLGCIAVGLEGRHGCVSLPPWITEVHMGPGNLRTSVLFSYREPWRTGGTVADIHASGEPLLSSLEKSFLCMTPLSEIGWMGLLQKAFPAVVPQLYNSSGTEACLLSHRMQTFLQFHKLWKATFWGNGLFVIFLTSHMLNAFHYSIHFKHIFSKVEKHY